MHRSRFLHFLKLFLGIFIILAGLLALYLMNGTSSAQTHLHYTVTLAKPTDQTLQVAITIQPGPTPFLDLFLREPVQDGRQRVIHFTAQRAGKPLAHWQAIPFLPDVVRVWNGFSTQPLTITYQVDPRWMKGPESPRSYLGSDFAYIRGMVTLYSPLAVNDILHPDFDHPGIEAGFAEADVLLPQGWKMVSPFGSGRIAIPAAYLRNAYFGFGPFATQELTFEKTPFLLGVYEGLPAERRAALSQQVPLLFQTMQKMTGFSPVSHTCFWSLAILPSEPIHGGASGTGSLVVQDDMDVIAHEMFHWWNGSTLSTSNDANWLKEGFTMYYAAKSMRASGLWSDAEFAGEMDRFQAKLWGRVPVRPVSLVEASNRLSSQNDSGAYNAVYYGGGLLAYQLDRQLQAQGKSLDALWPILNNLNKTVTTADFLKALETTGGADLAKEAEAILHGKAAIQIYPTSFSITIYVGSAYPLCRS